MTAQQEVIFAPNLADAFERVGMPYPERGPEPGRMCRFPTNGRKDAAGWCKLFLDQDGAVFGNWRDGSAFTWQRERNGPPPDAAELAEIRRRAEQIRKAAQAERDADHAQAASKAAEAWQEAAPAQGHPYLSAKGIGPHIARERGGWLVVPVFRDNGQIQSIQTIAADGSKRFMAGGKMAGGRCWIGEPSEGGPILITEGYATGASLHEATGSAVCIAFTADNLVRVAKDIRALYPEAQMVVCGDDDRRTAGNPGRTKAQEAAKAINAKAVFPTFIGDDGSDFNDMAQQAGPDAVRAAVTQAERITAGPTAWALPLPIDECEWLQARAAPDCIVERYLYADVGVLIAPGGVGKTTQVLFESIHIALGRDLYGLEVRKPGPVLILTAEDSREMLVARLRSICAAMDLTNDERRTVRETVRISDVSGSGLRLTRVIDDVVLPTESVDRLIEGCRAINPVLIVIDPAVSFGVGESRVNDAEQGLIEAARKLRNALTCCIRYIHHSGKQNGRDKTIDQYAGRGGSAFADGCRMVHVLQPLDPGEWQKATGDELQPGESALILARPKMSYCAPQGPLYIKRKGYAYTTVEARDDDPERDLRQRGEVLLALIRAEVEQGHYPTQRSLEATDTGMSRAQLRDTVAWLRAAGKVEDRLRPDTPARGAKTYLHPSGAATAHRPENAPETDPRCADEKDVPAAPPPIGNTPAAQRGAQAVSHCPDGSPEIDGAATAQRRSEEVEEVTEWF